MVFLVATGRARADIKQPSSQHSNGWTGLTIEGFWNLSGISRPLLRALFIIDQYPVDDQNERIQLRSLYRSIPPIPRRNRKLNHLLDSSPVDPEQPGRLPAAHTVYHHRTAHTCIKLQLLHPHYM
jgi:hypothetical protein